MTTITLTYGLPASGKSTAAANLVDASGGNLIRVNMDEIRSMLGFGNGGPIPWTKELEDIALGIQDQSILAAVNAGKDVIVDNTHIQTKMPKRYKNLFDGDVTFSVLDFSDVDVQTCINRDVVRQSQGKPFVGEAVIRRMAKQLEKPWRLTDEWMNDVVPVSAPLEYIPGLPWCIVWDTDGTTAKHIRSPYDYSKVLTDLPHNDVLMLKNILLDGAPEVPHLGMSGRPDTCREDTERWNDKYLIEYKHFHMRRGGDQRNDTVVKQEMVDNHIRGKYNILAWFDDRDRVVRRLRKLGIRVYQVNYGNF